MYCSTCGARVPDGRTRCDTCGAPVSRPVSFGVPAVAHASPGLPVAVVTCPRCGFQGPTVSYFSQGGHVAGLLMLALLTIFPTMGAGGLLYYLLRHNHRSCARCGETLGKAETLALLSASTGGGRFPVAAAAEADAGDEGSWRTAGGIGAILLFAFAAMMMMIGLAAGEAVPFFFSAFSAAGGGLLMHRAGNAREERRQALLVALQQPVLRLAGERAGRLTVTEVATSLGWPMRRAEKVLNSLDDGLRVASDVTSEGVIVYEFRELVHTQAPRLDAQEMDLLLRAGGTQAQPQADATQAQPLPLPRDGTLQA